MNKASKVVLIAVFVVLVVLLVGILFAISYAHLNRRQAERSLAVFQQIQVGTTDRATALQMTAAFRSHRSEWMAGEQPALEFSYDNRALFYLKLAPYTNFRASIVSKGGTVVEKHASEFAAPGGCAVSVTERRRGFGFSDGRAPAGHPNHIVHQNWNSPTSARQAIIEDDDTYGEEQRCQDWNFNLSCLTRFAACDANVMLPNVDPNFESRPSDRQARHDRL